MRKRWLQRVARAGTLLILVGSAITACQSAQNESDRDLGKALEHGAFDSLASIFSDYCNSVFDKGLWIQRTRIEVRREIRQSPVGRYGPSPPSKAIAGLDPNTANGKGPVVRIWCQGEAVPDVIWEQMVRDWRD